MLSPAQAARALYVDFECLATRPPHPALLGILTAGDVPHFEQIITDERLAPANLASRSSRVTATPAAVGELLDRAITESRLIVGWSYFDRDRLREARPDLANSIAERYVNALGLARPWRRAIYPDYPIEREDLFAASHTLNKYARLAGYPDAHRLVGAKPAQWIRHTLKQLAANDGLYRRTTPETKRDWHDLLEYNRHDCLALQHIALKASRELECWRAYERTRFCVDDGARRVCFLAGSASAKLDALLRRHCQSTWAFITAWNPSSIPLSRAENDERQAELRRLLAEEGYATLSGEGIGEDPAWEPEESLLVMGIKEAAAVRLGRRFGQLAIVVGRRGSRSRLVPCLRLSG